MDRKYVSNIHEMPIEVNNPQHKSDVKVIQNENKFIRKQNQLLRKQLDSLTNKLDIQIKKKMDQKVKPWNRSVDSTYLELQNAYKQCEIYKKEANFYKKKLQGLTNDSQKSVEIALCKDYLANQNKVLKEELKSLRKISKFQQKGLQEMGVQGHLKVVNENKKLSEQIKRLNKQLDEYRRGVHAVEIYDSEDENTPQKSSKRMAISSNGKNIKTEPRESYDRFKNIYSENSNQVDEMTQKVQKDYRKIRSLVGQRNKLRDQLAHSKVQLAQKDKQIECLKSKIQNLRKNNKFMQAQLGIKPNKDTEQEKQEIKSLHNKNMKQQPKYRIWSKNRTHSVNDVNQPRKQQRGRSPANTLKWNHQLFASKIVQIQILIHQQGHIQDMHVKYKKGEPERLSTYSNSQKYQIISCKPGQFVKHISGCFSDGYLQCLSIVTSEKRSKVFGNSFLLQGSDEQSQKFEFMIDKNQYPGSFYGQTEEKGIRKLGCLIMKQ